MKNTPIIKAIMVIFFSLTIMFALLSLVAFTYKRVDIHGELLKASLIIPAVILLHSLSKFREKSLGEQVRKVSGKINK